MSEEEKKDLSDPRINYRDDWANTHGERNEAANEKSNQAQGEKIERVRDADGGKVKSVEQILQEGKQQEGKPFTERIGKAETLKPPKEVTIEKLVEQNKGVPSEPKKKTQALFRGDKDLHLKSTTALTDPEPVKQKLNDAFKAKNLGKETQPSRGGFRGGGSPMMREPDEILKEKHKNTNPEDILSQKDKKPIITPPQQEQKSQPQQTKHRSSFMASLSAKIEEQGKKQEKGEKPIEPTPKREGIIAKLEKKVEEVKKSTAEKPASKEAKIEIAKSTPKPPTKSR